MDRQSDGDKDNFNLNSFKSLSSKSNNENIHSERKKVKVTQWVRNGAHAREGRDWLPTGNMSANQRSDKRKFVNDGDGDQQTKKRRPGH